MQNYNYCKQLNKSVKKYIKKVNQGGCGVFAVLFFKYHSHRFKSIQILADEPNDKLPVIITNNEACKHVYLNIVDSPKNNILRESIYTQFAFDGERIMYYDNNHEGKQYPYENLRQATLHQNNWNTNFNRKQIVLLEHIIKHAWDKKSFKYHIKLWYYLLKSKI